MVAKISTQMAVMPIAHFASVVKLKMGSMSNRRLASTQTESPMTVKRVNPRLISDRWVLKAISTAYPNMKRDRVVIRVGDAPRNSPSGFRASIKNSPLVNENMAFAFRMWCRLEDL